MPKGLADVTQKIGVDADDAVKGYKEGEDGARAYARATEDAEDKVRSLSEANDEAAERLRYLIRATGDSGESLDRLAAASRAAQDALNDADGTFQHYLISAQDAAKVNAGMRNEVIETGRAFTETSQALGEYLAQREKFAAGYEQIRAQAQATRELNAAQGELTRAISDTGDASNVTFSKSAMALEAYRTQLRAATADAENANAALLTLGAIAEKGQGGGTSLVDAAVAAGTVASAAGRDGGGGGNNLTRFLVGGPEGGFPASSLLGGDGGGGKIGKAGTAASYADYISGAVARAWPYIHYVTMAVAELAATVIPAATALGSASLVGLQGGQQMYTRMMAINNVEQSLGQAYGGTTGSFLGLQPKLQDLQNYAQGGVYEIGGAGINLVKSGIGTAFGGQGVQTIAMIDRGIADMQNNLAARGGGQQLGALFSGGTGYLRQFGDIGSNLGNIILGMAPHLPGVGEDWLSTVEGVTGGIAGGIGGLNKAHLGDILGGGMAYEAGWRLGTPLLGLLGKGIGGLGTLAGKMGLGDVGLTAADVSEMASSELLGDLGLGAGEIGLGGEGLAGLLSGAGGALGMLTGPAVGGLAVSAFLGSKLISSMPSPAQRRVAAMQAQIGQEGYTGALGMTAPPGFSGTGWLPLGKAITETTGLAGASPYASMSTLMGTSEAPITYARFGQVGPTTSQVYQNAAAGFEKQMSDLISSGPQIQAALSKVGLKGTSLADAFTIAQNSLLDLSHAFGSDGKLNKQAITMMDNYVAALTPMTQNAGALGAAIGAQTIMSQGSTKQLQEVNQSMDSMTSIMTGGAAGMASFFGLLGGAPVTQKKGGIQLQAPPSFKAMASALTSFSSAAGAGAWNTFAGSQGLITAEEQNLDQIRTALTLTAGTGSPFTVQQGMGLAGFQLEQLLPMAKQSPAALAMVMQQAAQMGIGGYYNQSESLAKNYQAAEKSIGGIADSTKQANAATNDMTVKLSNIPQIAQQFSTTVGTTLQSQEAARAATDLIGIQKTALGGGVDQSALKDWVSTLKGAGVEGGKAITETLDAQLKQMGVSGAMIMKINAELSPGAATAVRDQVRSIAGAHAAVTVPVKADTGAAQAAVDSIRARDVTMQVHADTGPAQAAINSVHGKSVSILISETAILRTIGNLGGLTSAPGVAPATLPGAPGGLRITNSQTGWRVPGFGGGDIVPAMLEPGEAVVPKHLVGALAPFLGRHGVPGFASGGLAGIEFGDTLTQASSMISAYQGSGNLSPMQWGQMSSTFLRAANLANVMGSSRGFASGGIVPASTLSGVKAQLDTEWKALDALYAQEDKASGAAYTALKNQVSAFWTNVMDPLYAQEDKLEGKTSSASAAASKAGTETAKQVIAAFEKTLNGEGSPWTSFGKQILTGLLSGVNMSKETSAMATALVNKVATEVNYAKGVASAAAGGAGYGTENSLFSGMDVTPGTGNGTVAEQMQSYLGSVKSFTGDLKTLSKEGLNKSVMQQLIAAGPVQGDALAQSISQSYGGVGLVNSLQKQITSASNKLGMQAGESVYGYGQTAAIKTSADLGPVQALKVAMDSVRSKTVDLHVNVTVGSGNQSMSVSQINQIVAKVQSQLLEQAKRNRKTGIMLPGYGA